MIIRSNAQRKVVNICCLLRILQNIPGRMVIGVERQRLIASCICFAVMLVGTAIILYNYRMRLYAIEVERLRSDVGDADRMKTRLHDLLTKKEIEERNYRRIIKNEVREKEKLEHTINELEAKLSRLSEQEKKNYTFKF
uniref:Uncharacterized protein n=1 Tax=Glossina palpalis gambiensis TaxID=67801 RepID=A0A1B0BA55_9MUSC